MPSVNSYCIITLEHLVVRDVNINSVKLRCLHLTFSSDILVRGVGVGVGMGLGVGGSSEAGLSLLPPEFVQAV